MSEIYLRTNFLLVTEKNDHWGRRMAIPYKGTFAQEGARAVTACQIGMLEEDLITVSKKFASNLLWESCQKNRDTVLDPRHKDDFIKKLINEKKLAELSETPDKMIWQDGVYRYNLISSDHGKIAIPGDFLRLSNAFMIALENGSGYVDVDVDIHTMTSQIRYSKPTQIAAKPAKKTATLKAVS